MRDFERLAGAPVVARFKDMYFVEKHPHVTIWRTYR